MSARRGRVIAFEGVDGAGKSTVIRHVAEALRARGQEVVLPRTGKEPSSRPARMVRRLGRDPRNYALSPRAELSLFCAREAQVLDETVRPAVARGATVLLDRSLLTPEVMGRFGRGLPREDCAAMVRAASGGLRPDLTLLFDVHPRTSRLRKRIEKVRAHTRQRGGRKGLSGSGFKARMREGYLAIGAERHYPIFHVERISPEALCTRVMTVVDGGAVEEAPQDTEPLWRGPADWDFGAALDGLPPPMALFMANGLRMARALRARYAAEEPALCAWSADPEDPLLEALWEQEPAHAVRRLTGRPLESDDLRERVLARDPEAGLAALRHLSCEASDALRTQYAERAPDGALRSLSGREDPFAEALRDRLWSDASDDARVTTLSHCDGDAAWKRRRKMLDKDPLLALETLRGVPLDRVPGLLTSLAPHAPKSVLRALSGREDDESFALRERLVATGREAVDSLSGLDHPRAWALRDAWVEAHPSTVLRGLYRLPDSERRRALVARCAEAGAGDLHLLRRMVGLAEWDGRPDWSLSRAWLAEEDG